MYVKRKKRKKKKKLTWQELLLIIMVVILALLLIFSRGFRAARRVEYKDKGEAGVALASLSGGRLSPVSGKLQSQKMDLYFLLGQWHHHREAPQGHATHMEAHQKHIAETGPAYAYPPQKGRLSTKEDRDMIKNKAGFGDITQDMLLGRIQPEADKSDFVEISRKYAIRQGMFCAGRP